MKLLIGIQLAVVKNFNIRGLPFLMNVRSYLSSSVQLNFTNHCRAYTVSLNLFFECQVVQEQN